MTVQSTSRTLSIELITFYLYKYLQAVFVIVANESEITRGDRKACRPTHVARMLVVNERYTNFRGHFPNAGLMLVEPLGPRKCLDIVAFNGCGGKTPCATCAADRVHTIWVASKRHQRLLANTLCNRTVRISKDLDGTIVKLGSPRDDRVNSVESRSKSCRAPSRTDVNTRG